MNRLAYFLLVSSFYWSMVVTSRANPPSIASTGGINAEVRFDPLTTSSVVVTLSNAGPSTVSYISTFYDIADANVRVYNAAGVPAPLNAEGEMYLPQYDSNGATVRKPPETISRKQVYIAPNEKKQLKIDLAKYFVLTPGNYRMSVRIPFQYGGSWDDAFVVAITNIEFTVK